MLNQIRRFLERKLFLERVHDIDKDVSIVGHIGAITREVDIHTSSAQLTVQVSECEQVIRAKQHMNRIRSVCNRLDDVELIQQPPARSDFAQMLRFVNQDGGRLSETQALFDCVAVFAPG